ncbi:hypothetical protein A1351_15430 [Methylosinus sp. R-45379]|uniref:DUF6538 domain-containing protein n=1 Tax=Methylosinus sp. R-45379 TaxID=980563 RepID=UPI0007D82C46|nr:DUF6538 domain-containing protein [Methylosinus sp. R-45379]OAI26172.1 hypothetical protein A1351_15430 [Methylosinus sp. R-45379]
MTRKIPHLLLREGRYFARLVVPAELRAIVGKTELRKPLGADRREAMRALPRCVADLQDVLSRARHAAASDGRAVHSAPARPMALGAVAHLHYDAALDRDARARDVPKELSGVTVPEINQWSAPARSASLRRVASGAASNDEVSAVVGWALEQLKDRGSFAAPHGSPQWRELARTLASVELEALARSLERDRGDYSGKPSFPPLTTPAPHEALADAVPLRDLFDGFFAELRRSGKGAPAEKRWKSAFDNLIKFLGHDDARKVTRSDLVKWRETLLTTHAARSVRGVFLASVKTVFSWAVDSERLPTNVSLGIKARVPRQQEAREKGFVDEEARDVLRAAKNYAPPTRERAHLTAAKKWVALLCCFTGARVAEITQLRKSDVRREGDITYIRITPEAGSVKTGMFRDVPLHKQILEWGFLEFVNAAPEGPLFYSTTIKRDEKSVHPSKQVAQQLAAWIRSLKIVNEGVAPNHGWRHRFKTICRDVGIDAETRDAIQGHAARTAGEAYGTVSLKLKAAAIEKFPRIGLEKKSG